MRERLEGAHVLDASLAVRHAPHARQERKVAQYILRNFSFPSPLEKAPAETDRGSAPASGRRPPPPAPSPPPPRPAGRRSGRRPPRGPRPPPPAIAAGADAEVGEP